MDYAGSNTLKALVDTIKEKFAAVNHTHSVSDLTDVLPVSSGGTGSADRAQAYKNLSTVVVSKANTSLDDYKTAGLYFFSAERSPVNNPSGTASGLAYVAAPGEYTIMQIWLNRNGEKIFYRVYSGSSSGWSDWREFKITDTTYSAATATQDGLMSASDKAALESLLNQLTNNSYVNSATINVGERIYMNGAASGGASSYEYAYYYKRSTSNTWVKVGTEFSSTTQVSFQPTSAGLFDIQIKVRDTTGLEVIKMFSVTVVESEE